MVPVTGVWSALLSNDSKHLAPPGFDVKGHSWSTVWSTLRFTLVPTRVPPSGVPMGSPREAPGCVLCADHPKTPAPVSGSQQLPRSRPWSTPGPPIVRSMVEPRGVPGGNSGFVYSKYGLINLRHKMKRGLWSVFICVFPCVRISGVGVSMLRNLRDSRRLSEWTLVIIHAL